MGPYSRLVGPDVAPPQDWQFVLPPAPAKLANMAEVETEINALMDKDATKTKEFVRVARNAANTFRHTDYLGGTNGACIRFSPGKDWKINAGVDKTLQALAPIKSKFGDGLSWADLIVLAATAAVKRLGAPADVPFLSGRTDAANGDAWEPLAYMNAEPPTTVDAVFERNALRGLSPKEFVALAFPDYPTTAALTTLAASRDTPDCIMAQALKFHSEFRHWVNYYISSGDKTYASDFGYAWTKVMNADRFDGPVHNCVLSDYTL